MNEFDASDPRVGTLLAQGRYRILARLAAGGMGVVYRAERVGLGRTVAIKFLHPDFAAQKEFLQRFEREARAMSRLTHPNCVPVIDFGVEDAPYIVLEFVTGKTLREVMDELDAPMPPLRAVRITRQVLAGLAHAHAQAIVHRDVKPANIIMADAEGTGDHARLLDFGLSKLMHSSNASWSTQAVAIGTPSYMSPEQCRGETVDARTDVYGVGILLFELCAGKKPFEADDKFEVLRMHIERPPPRLSEQAPGAPPDLDPILARALAKAPADRWASAAAMSDALAVLEVDLAAGRVALAPVTAEKPGRHDEAAIVERGGGDRRLDPEPVAPGRGRVLALGLALLVMGGAAIAWTVRERRRAVPPPARASAGDAAVAEVALIPDAGPMPSDAAPSDAAPADAAPADGSPLDASPPDAGPPDAGLPDAGSAATPDGGG